MSKRKVVAKPIKPSADAMKWAEEVARTIDFANAGPGKPSEVFRAELMAKRKTK